MWLNLRWDTALRDFQNPTGTLSQPKEAASHDAALDEALPVSFGTGVFQPTKRNFMTSKITSRAACLAEVTSNPKSFFNCPDMHGGSGVPEPAGSREIAAASKELDDGRWEPGARSQKDY